MNCSSGVRARAFIHDPTILDSHVMPPHYGCGLARTGVRWWQSLAVVMHRAWDGCSGRVLDRGLLVWAAQVSVLGVGQL
jgi:hypothetical protein